MTVQKCLLDAVNAVRGSSLINDEDKAVITEAIGRVVRDTTKSDERKLAAAIFAAREARKDMYVASITKKADDLAVVNLQERLDALDGPEERARFLRNLIEPEASYMDTTAPAVSNLARAAESRVVGRIGDIINEITSSVLLRDTPLALDVHRALLGLDTDNVKAKDFAKRIRAEYDRLLGELRDAGVYVPHRDVNEVGYFKRSHGISKIVSEFNEWAKDIRNRLDPELHPDPDATIARIYESLVTKETRTQDSATISMMRQVFFKTAQDELDYFYRWGEGSFGQVLTEDLQRLARQSVLARELGPSASNNFDSVSAPLRRAEQKRVAESVSAGDKAAKKSAAKAVTRLDRAAMTLESLTGRLHDPRNLNTAHIGNAVRNWMITQYLGKVALSIVGQDFWNTVFQNKFHTGGFASSFGQTVGGVVESLRGTSAGRAYGIEMGVFRNAMLAAQVDRYTSIHGRAENARGFSRQTAVGTQRATGVYALDGALRTGALLVISRTMMKSAKVNWGDLHPEYQKVLRANAFDPASWRRFQKAATAHESGAVDVDSLPRDIHDRAMAFLFREMDMAVVHPQHYDRAFLAAGTEAGTVPGELVRFMTQFWSWPIAFARGPMRRTAAMGGAPMVGFGSAMILSGAATSQLYTVVENQPSFAWDSPELWKRAIVRSGLLTPVGDILMSAAVDNNVDLGGPAASMLTSTVGNLTQAAVDVAEGDTDRAARRGAQVAKDLLVPNMWHTQFGLVSPAMDALMWELDAPYMRDRQRRFRKEGRNL